MQNQNKTRFEMGMPVIYINDGEVIKAKVDSTTKPDDVLGSYPVIIGWEYEGNNYESETFNKDGFKCITHDIPSLFTIPEYKALQALTNSFIDGTFGKEQKDNPLVNTKPFETFNGGEPETPNSISGEWNETTDLLDEDRKPVYFTEGMKVGCIYLGRDGVVKKINKTETFGVYVEWDKYLGIERYTFDGRYQYDHNNITLYPIEQYNQIQLPKLKPIQVPKPKADVIGLPSWFKGAMYLDNRNTISYLIGFLIGKEKVFDECLSMFNISLTDCSFVYCFARPIGDAENALCLDFIHNSRYYSLTIDVSDTENTNVLFSVQYNKNGIDTTEKII